MSREPVPTSGEWPHDDTLAGVRRIPVWAFIAIAAVYLGLIQGVSWLVTRNDSADYGVFPDAQSAWKNLVLPVGLSLVFVYAVVAVLGWWRPVFVDRRPVARWVWAIPAIMVVTILAGANYGGLSDVGIAVAGPLLLGTMMVGFAEEGMFRGLGVTTFRVNGFSEGGVALWSSVVFGLAHGTNIFVEGPSAILQVLVTVAAGYFFYLTRRVSGALVVCAVLHGFFDFGLLSSGVVKDEQYAGAALFVLADVVMVILLLVRRHRIELRPVGVATEGSPAVA